MKPFRKRPVVIEAEQCDGSRAQADRLGVRWTAPYMLVIPTREGEMVAAPGDWIIRGVHGELYPCKPEIFTATYDAVILTEGEKGSEQ